MSDIPYEDYEPVIGLEIHTQLNTRTKLFSRAPNSFGAEPNTNIGLVDTAQPGTLPLLNKEAVKKALRLGCALGSEIPHFCAFDRKSYFYPDNPRNFQITQFYHPIILGGSIQAEVAGKSKQFTIHHAHLEDDTGMLKHFSNFAGIDYNRAGVPLIEIVSDPCMHSPKEATAYAMAIRSLLIYLDISDGNMEEGSLRMDVNISVRKKGETSLRNKVEIKNLNSFSTMELAIESEIRRQVRAYSKSPYKDPKDIISQATLRFDLEKKETVVMRTKESADDYRYFPEPDLPPLFITEKMVEEIKKNLPELPAQRYERYVDTLALSEYNAHLLVSDKALSDYFEKGLAGCKNPKALCNWVTVEFVGRLKDTGKLLYQLGLDPTNITSLVNLIEDKKITGRIAKTLADIMVAHPEKTPEMILKENPDLLPIQDDSEVEKIVDLVLSKNEQSVIDFKNGVTKAFQYLIGPNDERITWKSIT